MPPNIFVHMIADPIATIPVYPLPDGYHFRPYRSDDEATWTAIQRAAEPFFAIEDGLFRAQYGDDEKSLGERMRFVERNDGTPAGTITAWWKDDWEGRGQWGQIHWVAVHPEHQRHGISKAMMTWAMQKLAGHYPRAMLGTSTGRVWAIKVYLDFGFCPDPKGLEQPVVLDAWRAVQTVLQHPRLDATLPGDA
jgi:GNAT superfamily N-acetyltransferase